MFYHASQTPGIDVLQPRVSNHHVPLIYFSKKRENVLVYLSNAIEKYCRETVFAYHGPWQKWGPYGFDQQGRLQFQEYYPMPWWTPIRGYPGISTEWRPCLPVTFLWRFLMPPCPTSPSRWRPASLSPMPWRPSCRRSGRGSSPFCAMSSSPRNFKPGTVGPSGRSTKTPRTIQNTVIF